MSKVRKAVIPAAGYGTRFLPVTKAQPKEMLPVVAKPIIQYVVEEVVAAGITDIIIVTGSSKRALEDHFDYNYELESWLRRQGKTEQEKEIKQLAEMANFIYVRQKGPYGNGTPLMCAREIVGDEPFVYIWGDEFIYANPPRTKQCLDVFEKYTTPVISSIRVPQAEISKYGIAEVSPVQDNVYEITKMIEKPSPSETSSTLALLGCYLLTPDIFNELEKVKPGKAGEIWIVDAIRELMKKRPVYTCEIKNGTYYDTGSKLGWLRANVDFALRDPELKDEFKKYLQSVV